MVWLHTPTSLLALILSTCLLSACVAAPEEDSSGTNLDDTPMEEISPEDDVDKVDESTRTMDLYLDHDCQRTDDAEHTWYSLEPEAPALGDTVTIRFHAESSDLSLEQPSFRIVTAQHITDVEAMSTQTSTQTIWRTTLLLDTPDDYHIIFHDARNGSRYMGCSIRIGQP